VPRISIPQLTDPEAVSKASAERDTVGHEDHLRALATGTLHAFTTWKQDAGVPEVAVGVYTIWRRTDDGSVAAGTEPEKLVYVGYAGRGLVVERVRVTTQGRAGSHRKGLWDRLQAHARGRRSGDQFAVYVADRWVLPTLSQIDIADVAEGRVLIDTLVRTYIANHLGFRWVETPNADAARKIEMLIRRGDWAHGKPLLNPLER
jgi:hypothetical protein